MQSQGQQPSDPPPSPRGYYLEHVGDLPQQLRAAVTHADRVRLHARSGWRHAVVALRQVLTAAACVWALCHFHQPWIWLPLAALQGTVLLSSTILLHEVVHGVVFAQRRPRLSRLLGLLYAAPTGISASQFTRWHLDHHSGLGSAQEDPKRAHLSPKRNARWFKALYMTPALFVIYARASATEAATYSPSLRRRIRIERLANVLLHAAFVAFLWRTYDGEAVLRAHLVPLFVFFPPAFVINRLGQHYWIDPTTPAKWSTRLDGNPLVRWIFLNSNHHIEHHYFPSVPLYNLPALNVALRPFWQRIGHPSRTYAQLLWRWFADNRQAHTDWNDLA